MVMSTASCIECGTPVHYDFIPKQPICFRCKVKSVSLGFVRGKEEFHGPTIRERQRLQEAQATAAGIAWDKVPSKATF